MLLPLAQAADLAGVSKSALFKAIKRGRLSAVRDAVSGEWRVDVRELERVYTLVNSPETDGRQSQNESAPVTADHVHYEARIAALESERDYLRQALEREADDRRQLMRLLPGPQPSAEKSARTPWKWLLLALMALGAVLVWLVVERQVGAPLPIIPYSSESSSSLASAISTQLAVSILSRTS